MNGCVALLLCLSEPTPHLQCVYMFFLALFRLDSALRLFGLCSMLLFCLLASGFVALAVTSARGFLLTSVFELVFRFPFSCR